ncbi:diacylglycerol kinase family lipid kinase [Marinilactibacillus sp. XAAS-LB27]|uniref:diacylglycerol kinase family lipid kinase n=1 Tax=Marinilactibacillus sp. XAAS-LB27 TaxID=3114538 RepID=UPI002E17681E|nr:diacylglycerol kinase family lipid kinase [Marinilactibacillus sp. XAAS-LB27]
MRKRARIIYNPTSGREQVKRSLPDILKVYEDFGYDTSAYCTTTEPLSAQKEAKRCADEQFDLVIAAGGDGTINEVINGIAVAEKRPKVAIIPAGTTNDYARALHVPRGNLVAAAKVIEKDQSVFMDIGKVSTASEERFFMNIGAAGFLSEVSYEVPANMKSLFGSLAYFAKGAELLPRIGKVPVRVEYDDGVYEGQASMVFVALTNSVGGFEEIAPDKTLGDGKFTLIIVKATNLVEIMRLVTLLMNDGKHINSPNIVYTKTSKVVTETIGDRKLMINIDGEYGGDAPATFINYRQHIEMVGDIDGMKLDIDTRDATMEEKETDFIKQVSELEEQSQ